MGRNVGIARSLNAGVGAAAAPFVAVQDADDYSDADAGWSASSPCSRPTRASPSSACACTRSTRRAARWRRARRFAAGDVGAGADALQPDPQHVGDVPPRRRPAAGGYDPRYRYAMEYDLWLRLAERWRLVTIDEALATRVMGGENVAARAERAQLAEGMEIRARALSPPPHPARRRRVAAPGALLGAAGRRQAGAAPAPRSGALTRQRRLVLLAGRFAEALDAELGPHPLARRGAESLP